jgi:hypothetical protein
MKKRTIMTVGSTTLIAMLGVTAVIGVNSSVPADSQLASTGQHSTHGPADSDHHSSAESAFATASSDLAPVEIVDEAGVLQLSAVTPSAVTPSTVTPSGVPSDPTAVVRDSSGKLVLGGVFGNRADKPAPGKSAGAPGQEIRVTPFPKVPSAGDNPGIGNGKPQSLGEALAKPHGVAAGGVSPAGSGVDKSITQQAPGLPMRVLARGEQDAGVNDAARTGGCAPGYGDGRSCLPVSPPSAAEHAEHGMKVNWTCEELLTLFPEGIPLQVRGTDPLRLDEDGNGIACA